MPMIKSLNYFNCSHFISISLTEAYNQRIIGDMKINEKSIEFGFTKDINFIRFKVTVIFSIIFLFQTFFSP